MKTKREKKKRVISLFALMLSVTIITSGCGGKEKVASENRGEIPKELSIWSQFGGQAGAAGLSNNNEILGWQLLEEKTGCHVEWIHPPQGTHEERFNVMIASGKLPDMITWYWRNVQGGVETYADDGYIIPLKELIAENMPNLSAFMKERPELAKQFTNDAGEIYFIPFIRKDKELGVFTGPLMRTDWLEKLGLDVPKNTDELREVLRAFKNNDPNGNGEKDEIPMSGVSFENSGYGIGCLTAAFGTHHSFYIKDGKVTHGIYEDEMTDALSYMNSLYAEGLIDPDYLVNDRNKMDAKVVNNRVGFLYSFQPTQFYNKMNDGRKVSGIPHLAGPDGSAKCFVSDYANLTTSMSVAVTTANKNPEGTLKWLDTLFSEEGRNIVNFGEEGKTYNWVDGEPILSDYMLKNPEGKTPSEMFSTNIIAFESCFPVIQDWRYYKQYLSPWGAEAVTAWTESADISGILPILSFTAEENDRISEIYAQAGTFIVETYNKMVLGSESVSNMPAVREKLNTMGFNEVIDIYNQAYKRYLAR